MSPLPILATIITLILAARLARRLIETQRSLIPARARRTLPTKR
ncbi:hypothetical protein [Zoogloea sp.]